MEAVLTKRRPLTRLAEWVPWLLPVLCFALTALVFGVRYEVNDDAILANIAAGAYGPDTVHLVYQNVLIGWLLKPLYLLAPGLNWLYVLQTVLVLAALGVLCRALWRELGPGRGLLAACLLLWLVGIDVFSSFQYVKNSGVLLAAGFVLLIRNLGRWNKGAAGGLALVTLGSMLRFQNFAAVGALAAAALLWRFLSLERAAKKRAAAAMAALFALVLGAKAVDMAAYSLDEGWAAYARYNAARTQVSDFLFQNLDSSAPVEALGYTNNDCTMLASWSYYDPAVFGSEQLELLERALPRRSVKAAVKDTAKEYAALLWGGPCCFLLAGVVLLWLFFSGRRGRGAFVATMAMLAALVFYLALKGRFVHRVEFVLVLAAAAFGALCCTPREDADPVPRRVLACGAAALVLVCMPYYLALFTEQRSYLSTRTDQPAYTEFSQDKEHLYLADADAIDSLAGYDVLHPRPAGFFSNIVELGGWLSGAPHRVAALQSYGVENPYAALARNDRVYLLDFFHISAKEIYLAEHYGVAVERVRLRELPTFSLYRFDLTQSVQTV